jgi:hypothetical protein
MSRGSVSCGCIAGSNQAMAVKVVGREKPELRLIFEGTCFDAKGLACIAPDRGSRQERPVKSSTA